MSTPAAGGGQPEDRGLVTRLGPLEVDWPKTLGYYGGLGLAVAFELIEPPLAIFIAAVPILKLLKQPGEPWPLRIAADVLEGAAKPVGGDAESVVQVANSSQGSNGRGRPPSARPARRPRAAQR
jgi:hypothetical protein